jgi:hypothetical protein
MNAVVKIETRTRVETPNERQARLERVENPPGGLLAALNERSFSGTQMRAAVHAVSHVPLREPADMAEHSRILREFFAAEGLGTSDHGIAGLEGRLIAMNNWCAKHDPHGQTDVEAFFEAAGRQPLISTNEGIGFEPVSFGELIRFIAELPF